MSAWLGKSPTGLRSGLRNSPRGGAAATGQRGDATGTSVWPCGKHNRSVGREQSGRWRLDPTHAPNSLARGRDTLIPEKELLPVQISGVLVPYRKNCGGAKFEDGEGRQGTRLPYLQK